MNVKLNFPLPEYFNLWNVSLWVQSGHTQVQLRAMGRKLVSTEQFAETWLLLFSDCYQRPKLADHSHVPPLCGSFHAGTKPGGQEEKTRDKDKEQHMVTKVQRNLPVVSRKQNTTHFS